MPKETASFTIEKETLKKFNEYCKENTINRSGMVERLLQEFLKRNETSRAHQSK